MRHELLAATEPTATKSEMEYICEYMTYFAEPPQKRNMSKIMKQSIVKNMVPKNGTCRAQRPPGIKQDRLENGMRIFGSAVEMPAQVFCGVVFCGEGSALPFSRLRLTVFYEKKMDHFTIF